MMTGKITGMLLENDIDTLTPLLTDPDGTELTGRIDEATRVILQAATEMSTTTTVVIATGSAEDGGGGEEDEPPRLMSPPPGGRREGAESPQLPPMPIHWQQQQVYPYGSPAVMHMPAPLSPDSHMQMQQQMEQQQHHQQQQHPGTAWVNGITGDFKEADLAEMQLPAELSSWNLQHALSCVSPLTTNHIWPFSRR